MLEEYPTSIKDGEQTWPAVTLHAATDTPLLLRKLRVVLNDFKLTRVGTVRSLGHYTPCEYCRPRRAPKGVCCAVHQGVKASGRVLKRKTCEELLKSWKTPTRRHRLPGRLRDYILDKTLLHLMEFSEWYNQGRLAHPFICEMKSVRAASRMANSESDASQPATTTLTRNVADQKRQLCKWRGVQKQQRVRSRAKDTGSTACDREKNGKRNETNHNRCQKRVFKNHVTAKEALTGRLIKRKEGWHMELHLCQEIGKQKDRDRANRCVTAKNKLISQISKSKAGYSKEDKGSVGKQKKVTMKRCIAKNTLNSKPSRSKAVLSKLDKNTAAKRKHDSGNMKKCASSKETLLSRNKKQGPVKDYGNPAAKQRKKGISFAEALASVEQTYYQKPKIRTRGLQPKQNSSTKTACADTKTQTKCIITSNLVQQRPGCRPATKKDICKEKCSRALKRKHDGANAAHGQNMNNSKSNSKALKRVRFCIVPKEQQRKSTAKGRPKGGSHTKTVVQPKRVCRSKKDSRSPKRKAKEKINNSKSNSNALKRVRFNVAPREQQRKSTAKGRPVLKNRKSTIECKAKSKGGSHIKTVVQPKRVCRPKKDSRSPKRKAKEKINNSKSNSNALKRVRFNVAPREQQRKSAAKGRPMLKNRKNKVERNAKSKGGSHIKTVVQPKKVGRLRKDDRSPKRKTKENTKTKVYIRLSCAAKKKCSGRITKAADMSSVCHQERKQKNLGRDQNSLCSCNKNQKDSKRAQGGNPRELKCFCQSKKVKQSGIPKEVKNAASSRGNPRSAIKQHAQPKQVGRPRKCKNHPAVNTTVNVIPDSDLLQMTPAQTFRLGCSKSVNPDFTIADSSAVNISDYLSQIGSYLDGADKYQHGDSSCDLQHDKNNNLITEINIPHTLGDASLYDEGIETAGNMPCGSGKISLKEGRAVSRGNRRGTRRGAARGNRGGTGSSAGQSRRRNTKPPVREGTRRSERLRARDKARRYKELWTNGHQDPAGRGSRRHAEEEEEAVSLPAERLKVNRQAAKRNDVDDLLQEFEALGPLTTDMLFSEEDCLSLLAESPIFGMDTMVPGRPIPPCDCGSIERNREGHPVLPKLPPIIQRSYQDFLLDEFSLQILAGQSSPQTSQGRLADMELDDSPVSHPVVIAEPFGMRSGFSASGGLVGSLLELGLELREVEPLDDDGVRRRRRGRRRGGEGNAGESDHVTLVPTSPPANHQETILFGQVLSEKKVMTGRERRKGTVCEQDSSNLLEVPVIVPSFGYTAEEGVVRSMEVWLPAVVTSSDSTAIFLQPLGHWSREEGMWCVPDILWRSAEDGSWCGRSEIRDAAAKGVAFVPERAWLVAQGALLDQHCRVYHINPKPEALRDVCCCQQPQGPHSDTEAVQLLEQRGGGTQEAKDHLQGEYNLQQPLLIPVPGDPPPVPWQGIPGACYPWNPSNLDHRVGTTSNQDGYGHGKRAFHSSVLQNNPSYLWEAPDPGLHLAGTPLPPHHRAASILLGRSPQLPPCSQDENYPPHSVPLRNPATAMSPASLESAFNPSLKHSYVPSSSLSSPEGLAMCGSNETTAIQTIWQDTPPDNHPLETTLDMNNNVIPQEWLNPDIPRFEGRSAGSESVLPVSSGEAIDWVKGVEDVHILGSMYLDWCQSDLPFRGHRQLTAAIDQQLEKMSIHQSAPVFCSFVCSFHAAMQKAHHSLTQEDESTLVQLGLSSFSRCLVVQETTLLVQEPTSLYQDPMADETQLKEDAYCILQILSQLGLPLTEVLASLFSPSGDSSAFPWLRQQERTEGILRAVLKVLTDYDPVMAFNVIQGVGWHHHSWVSTTPDLREGFNQQLTLLAEALLECRKYWQCSLLITHLLTQDGYRESCRHLSSTLLSKLLDSPDSSDMSLMGFFEDMMDACLTVSGPLLSRLLSMLWRRLDEASMEDALCVFHYGLGLGIYPMFQRGGAAPAAAGVGHQDKDGEDPWWELTVFLEATEAEIFFSLRTLLDEILHQLRIGQDSRSGSSSQCDGIWQSGDEVGNIAAESGSASTVQIKRKGRGRPRKQCNVNNTPLTTKDRGKTAVGLDNNRWVVDGQIDDEIQNVAVESGMRKRRGRPRKQCNENQTSNTSKVRGKTLIPGQSSRKQIGDHGWGEDEVQIVYAESSDVAAVQNAKKPRGRPKKRPNENETAKAVKSRREKASSNTDIRKPGTLSEIVSCIRVYIMLLESPVCPRDYLLSDDEAAIEVFSRMLKTKSAIQDVLCKYFHPLTVGLCADRSRGNRASSNAFFNLALNQESLCSWLLTEAQ